MANIKIPIKDILAILDEAIDKFTTSKYAHYWSFLQNRGLYRQRLNHYINVKPNKAVIEKVEILKQLQEQKLLEGMLNKQSDIQSIGALFILKSSHGYIEEEKRQQNEIAREKLKQDQELDGVGSALDINFNIVEHRSEEEIQKLLDDAEDTDA